MAGDGPADNPNLKGFSRYFNAETNFGRANVSLNFLNSKQIAHLNTFNESKCIFVDIFSAPKQCSHSLD